ncbi:hypothetical protein [Pseudomonas aeruginosa]|uniref:hypothetical protein n=1 Tax=Pseudomonas aeruginosa TaxID=287 RepID=UPI00283AAACE|nr:hypothetical protein [Pseudomonas aeruginosa]WMU81967.1 hypothetical protein P4G01_16285 [Pseudomonas aeruginosa]
MGLHDREWFKRKPAQAQKRHQRTAAASQSPVHPLSGRVLAGRPLMGFLAGLTVGLLIS